MGFVLVSAETAGGSPHENLGNSIALHEWLNDTYGVANVGSVHGQYQGRGEAAFRVNDVSVYDAWDIWEYAHDEFAQESVLFVDENDEARLLFDRPGDDGGRDDYPVGVWTELRGKPERGDWTLIGNTYFQVR